MIHRLLADAVLVLQLAFIVFVVAGGLFLLRWPRLSWLPWLHLPPPCFLPVIHAVGLNREWPIALGLTTASFPGFLVHEGTQQELGAGTEN